MMSHCPKCGNEITEEMAFCPKCGAALKTEQVTVETRTRTHYRDEKAEKEEKGEKREKGEKHEKRGYSFMGPLIGGLILIFIGLASYLVVTYNVKSEIVWAFFFVVIGIVIIVGAIYGSLMASRRHPRA
jgi:uncharacterized membrane protein YvbJ